MMRADDAARFRRRAFLFALVFALGVSTYLLDRALGAKYGPLPPKPRWCEMPGALPAGTAWGLLSAHEQGAVIHAWRACVGQRSIIQKPESKP